MSSARELLRSKGIRDDLDAHLGELLKQDEEFRRIWEADAPKRELATEVLRRRSELGWSQRQLAAELGTSQNYVYELESGQANPTLETMQKLATTLGGALDVHVLVAETELDHAAEALADEVVDDFESLREDERKAVVEGIRSQGFRDQFMAQLAKEMSESAKDIVVSSSINLGETQRAVAQILAKSTADAYVNFFRSQLSYYRTIFGKAEGSGDAPRNDLGTPAK